MADSEMATYAVVQTADAFGYPAGKRWGPYVHKCDAEARVTTLQRHKGDGVIGRVPPETPCAERRTP